MSILRIGNVSSKIEDLPQETVDQLDQLLTYSTAPEQDGWKPPEFYMHENFWDGKIHLGRKIASGTLEIPTGLVPMAQEALVNYPVTIVDERKRPEEGLPWISEIPLRDYQKNAVKEAIKTGYGVLDAPPRSGKTRWALEVHRQISLPTLWIAPTTNIVTQTVRAAEQFFPKGYAVVAMGRAKLDLDAPIIITTAATAHLLPQSVYDTRQMVFYDEIHHFAARTYRQINAKTAHIFHRFGMSGTFFRSGNDDLALQSVISNVISKISAEDLVQDGYLVEADVVYLPVDGPRVSGGGVSFQAGAGRHGISAHSYRNRLVAWAAATILARGKQLLILVATKEQGRTIQEQLEGWLPGHIGPGWRPVEFVSTDRPAKTCQEVIDAFSAGTVKVLIGTSMIGEGTDLPSADALIYAQGGKAEVSHSQAAYRVCTAVAGKGRALIVDFADRHNKTLMGHARQRLETYYGHNLFKTHVLESPGQLPAFLDGVI